MNKISILLLVLAALCFGLFGLGLAWEVNLMILLGGLGGTGFLTGAATYVWLDPESRRYLENKDEKESR